MCVPGLNGLKPKLTTMAVIESWPYFHVTSCFCLSGALLERSITKTARCSHHKTRLYCKLYIRVTWGTFRCSRAENSSNFIISLPYFVIQECEAKLVKIASDIFAISESFCSVSCKVAVLHIQGCHPTAFYFEILASLFWGELLVENNSRSTSSQPVLGSS